VVFGVNFCRDRPDKVRPIHRQNSARRKQLPIRRKIGREMTMKSSWRRVHLVTRRGGWNPKMKEYFSANATAST